jgi:hypothetical protein
MTSIAPIYLSYQVLIDCCMPTCTCTHVKLSKASFFLGQILNPKMSFFLGRTNANRHADASRLTKGSLKLQEVLQPRPGFYVITTQQCIYSAYHRVLFVVLDVLRESVPLSYPGVMESSVTFWGDALSSIIPGEQPPSSNNIIILFVSTM